MINLDLVAAEAAREIVRNLSSDKAKEVEALVRDTHGVVQENGPYAGLLFLLACKGDEDHVKKIRGALLSLLPKMGVEPINGTPIDILDKFGKQVCKDLDRLLLVKQLWEQTLIYARYGAKAREDEPTAASDEESA